MEKYARALLLRTTPLEYAIGSSTGLKGTKKRHCTIRPDLWRMDGIAGCCRLLTVVVSQTRRRAFADLPTAANLVAFPPP